MVDFLSKRHISGLTYQYIESPSKDFNYISIRFQFPLSLARSIKPGLLHFLEHYILTAKYGGVEFFTYLVKNHIKVEAITFWDRIEFNLITLQSDAEKALNIFSNHFNALHLDLDVIEDVRSSVLNEIKETTEDENELTNNYVIKRYQIPNSNILGTTSIINTINKADIKDFLDKYFFLDVRVYHAKAEKSKVLSIKCKPIVVQHMFNSIHCDPLTIIKHDSNNDYLLSFATYKSDVSLEAYYLVYNFLFGDGTNLHAYFPQIFRLKENELYSIGGIFLNVFDDLHFVVHIISDDKDLKRIIQKIHSELLGIIDNDFVYRAFLEEIPFLIMNYRIEMDNSKAYLEQLTTFREPFSLLSNGLLPKDIHKQWCLILNQMILSISQLSGFMV